MPPAEDFDDAHRRHWDDAEILFAKGRLANADHLYGLSAECALKAMMRRLDMPVDEGTGTLAARYREHLPKLWRLFVDLVSGRRGASRLEALLSEAFRDCTPFSDWRIADRYASAKHFQHSNVEPHRVETQRIRVMYDQERLDMCDKQSQGALP